LEIDCSEERWRRSIRGSWHDLRVENVSGQSPSNSLGNPFAEIAGYRLLGLLGQGGFASTFKAEKDGALYAVKVLNELPVGEAAARFEHEVEALQLEHANLVRYVESGIGSFGGLQRPYIVMPFIPGQTLRQAIDAAAVPLKVDDLRSIAAAVADGLAFLHDHNTAHRDVTPKNIFLTESSEVLILDFGLAKLQDRTSVTHPGHAVGTLAYLAPEQLRNEDDLHSDIYGLGATLYEALCQRRMFEAGNIAALVEMIRHEDPEPPSTHNPLVPDDLDELVIAMLEKEPVQRPSSALVVAANLRAPSAGHRAKPQPYDRDLAPKLAVRATTASAGRALLGAAMMGRTPQIGVAAVTTPPALNELRRAAGFNTEMKLAVDSKVETTASIAMPRLVRGLPFSPESGVPYEHNALRQSERCKRIARGDIAVQAAEGATLFRSACFPFSGPDDPWIKRNRRLLSDELQARNAIDAEVPLYATIRCDIDALVSAGKRISIANRFTREAPQGYWIEIYDLNAGSKPEVIAAAFDLFLMMQERGVGTIASLPGPLVELAWSVGVAGAEVKLGRVGGAHGATVRTPTRSDQSPRFDFGSIFTSLPAEQAIEILDGGVLPESECQCPSCQLAQTPRERVASADDHDLAGWLALREALGVLSVEQRVERLKGRFAEAEGLLAAARKVAPKNRFSARTVRTLSKTLELLNEGGALAAMGKLRRSV